jgi:hypothetical protein
MELKVRKVIKGRKVLQALTAQLARWVHKVLPVLTVQ